ncbi:sigma factor [Kribbella qitaiheensis]|uniref:sigma factor n=1 Tax=Kribbella qitaiheensis TaxID=1544730 RepID=UPI001FE85697|nr:sigma factor [Kribbella qitaiheensis]
MTAQVSTRAVGSRLLLTTASELRRPPYDGTVTSDLDEAAAGFAGVRPRLFGIAYRMLGSSAEAEDIVQDAWLRWQAYDRSKVIEPAAFLATTTTRLAINAAQSARVRRESYIGPWLPEPIDTANDPALGAERDDALELAQLHLLEKLSPTQRAAYVLREAFDYPYDEIAETSNCRRRMSVNWSAAATNGWRPNAAIRSAKASTDACSRPSSQPPGWATSPRWRRCSPRT